MAFPRPVVKAEWLQAHLGQADLAVVDCRFSTLEGPDAGRQAYERGHIPGAVYLDLERDLSGPRGEHGGRHPLPDPAALAARLGAAGIGPGVKVVAYDNSGEMAARCWWILRWLGHDEVAVLDGGLGAWRRAGGRLEAAVPRPAPRTFTPRPRPELVVTMPEVRDRPPGTVLVDARSPERFAGQPNPLDAIPGHIPGAVNRFWQDALNPDGTYKSPAEQAVRLAGLAPEPARIIHSCGSGVTACVNLIAMELAGLPGARLYVGSYSDWYTYPENPIAT